MNSGSRRDPRSNTTSHLADEPIQPFPPTAELDRAGEPFPPSAARPSAGAHPLNPQPQYGPPRQSTPMALQPPLLPSIPPSFGHHRSEFSIDSSSSRTSVPSPGRPHRRIEGQVATPDTSPTWPGRRSSVQKRAFRQRRKDPSCDACRERKVKCDATESRSCTECANRGVRCQFTKDTNRRMSSIKQVQELERQLAQIRQQNERLKLMLSPSDRMELDVPTESSSFSASRMRLARPHDYTQTRQNTRQYARGIFRPPPAHRRPSSKPATSLETSSLPGQQESSLLAETCRNSFLNQLSLVEWNVFMEELNSVYETSSAENVSRSWMALFFSVLAIGSLQNRDHSITRRERRDRAEGFVTRASEYLSFTDENITLDHCRAALLLSVYHVEANKKPAGWTWLSAALSFAFDLGLHDDRDQANSSESEQRWQLWCSIYSWERLLSLETSRPLLIDDDDCHIVTPPGASLDSGREESSATGSAARSGSFLSRSIVPLMRLYGSLRKVTRNPVISSAALMTFESLLEPISASYPRPLPPANSPFYDIGFFTFTILISNASLTLNRQNLMPACSTEQCSAALEKCTSAARLTERCIRDSLIHFGAPEQSSAESGTYNPAWVAWLQSSASALFCTHFWRCILVLAFAMDFQSAMVCAKASGAVGDMRDINLACGRHLVFFLERLAEKLRLGEHNRQNLLEDMEMVAYVSGDMQGDVRSAWIWNSEYYEIEEAANVGSASQVPEGEGEASAEGTPDEANMWPRVEELLQHLERERTRQRPLPEFEGPARPLSARPMSPDEGNKRMSIASIM